VGAIAWVDQSSCSSSRYTPQTSRACSWSAPWASTVVSKSWRRTGALHFRQRSVTSHIVWEFGRPRFLQPLLPSAVRSILRASHSNEGSHFHGEHESVRVDKDLIALLNAHDIEGYLKHIDPGYTGESKMPAWSWTRRRATDAGLNVCRLFPIFTWSREVIASGDHVVRLRDLIGHNRAASREWRYE